MKRDCMYFDECEIVGLSECCNAPITLHDICFRCREHCDDTCDDCEEYILEDDYMQNMRDNAAEEKYELNKNNN